ncbi:unnamed protein product, partial [Staurois parvus]
MSCQSTPAHSPDLSAVSQCYPSVPTISAHPCCLSV